MSLVVNVRSVSIIVGIAHAHDHKLVLKCENDSYEMHEFAVVQATLSTVAARNIFQMEHEVMKLRHRLCCNAYVIAMPDVEYPKAEQGKSLLAKELARLQKREWLSIISGHLWANENNKDIDCAYKLVCSYIIQHESRIHMHLHAMSCQCDCTDT